MIRNVRILAWTPAALASLMLLAIYSSWAVAYAQLGRLPQPMIDDPKSIGGFATAVYEFCSPLLYVLFIAFLVTSFIACLVADSPKAERGRGWWVGFGFAAGLLVFGLPILIAKSPGDAIEWFFD